MKKILILFSLLFIFACQPIEKNEQIIFDNKQLSKFDILASRIVIKTIFEEKISEPYIGHTLKISPKQRLINWVKDNFKPIGNENNFNVTILDASLIRTEFLNKNAKSFNEKNNYKYELFYLVEFSLYDDSKNLVASTLVEIVRTTTSGLYISIQDKENIINDLVYLSLIDLSNESQKLLTKYMSDFIL